MERRSPRPRPPGSSTATAGAVPSRRRLPLDALVAPGLLLLVGRELLLFDPARALAWRFLHEPRLADLPARAAALLPRPDPGVDRDPVSLVLGSVAVLLAALYLLAGSLGARPRTRAALLAVGALLLVLLPTAGFVAMGTLLDRPYGQDGGVVQLPLAMEKILAGESPYGADYSDSILGKQARVSDFWGAQGGNPILRHHAYLPGTHLLVLPFYLASRALVGGFDPRLVTSLFYLLAALLAARLAGGASPAWVPGATPGLDLGPPARALSAAAVVLANPLLHWQQVFGANDVVPAALLLLALALARGGRPWASSAVLGLLCATKQLAWPFAPFLLAHLAGLRGFRDLQRGKALLRLARLSAPAAGVFLAVVAPVAALDLRAFWGDIVVYNVGLPGADNYPLGGTPGFGFANLVIYLGRVSSLRDFVPLGASYLVLVPLGLCLLALQMRSGRAETVLLTGSVALVGSLYLSRVVHPNYLVLAAVALPLAALCGAVRRADVALVPLLLLGLAVGVAEQEVLRTAWEDALSVRLPEHLAGLGRALLPRAGRHLTLDPLGLLASAVAAGLGVAYLVAGSLGLDRRGRLALAGLAFALAVAAPALVVARVGAATGAPRLQDARASSLSVLAREAAGRSAPPVPRQAWSTSFRRDPPRAVEAPPALPLERPLALLMARLGALDPRGPALIGLLASALLLARGVPAPARPLAAAALALSPVAALGLLAGSLDGLLLAVALGARALAGEETTTAGPRRSFLAGLVLGLASGLFPRALFLAPLLAPCGARALLGLGVGACAALALPGHEALVSGLLVPDGGAVGLGLGNLRLYAGDLDPGPVERLLPALALAAALALAGVPALRRRALTLAPSPVLAALCLLAGAWVTPGSSPDELLTPLALLLLAGTATPGKGMKLVPEAGLEPAWVAPHAPQTCVSASSTTPAPEG